MAKPKKKPITTIKAKPKSSPKQEETPLPVAKPLNPDAPVKPKLRKKKVRALVNDSGRYGVIKWHLERGKFYEFHEELAEMLIRSNRAV